MKADYEHEKEQNIIFESLSKENNGDYREYEDNCRSIYNYSEDY